jgi:pimeloyl-ACP methyl ester carboxylesterase
MDRRIRSALVVALLVGAALWVRHQRGQDAAPVVANAPTAQAAGPVAPSRPTRQYGAIGFQPCTLSAPLGANTAEAQCGTFVVPEDRAHPDGRKIKLAIAWLPATGEAAPDPVFMLAGGPGQGARESYPSVAPAFAEVRKKHHVILLDQRGTGDSNPLVCKDAQGRSAVSGEEDDSIAEARAFAARCAKILSARSDPRFYTTGEAIDDLDAVRAALGAAQVDLVGISYGTRVAQQYAQRYPKRTRTIVLDGVVPNTLVLGAEHARNLESSLGMQFERCRKEKACVQALGDPRQQLDALIARVEADPPLVRYRDGITGEAREERLTRNHIAMLARMFAYAPQVAGLLPLELHEAIQGRYEPLMALSRLVTGAANDSIMHGMQLSVTCAEDADELVADPKDASSLISAEFIEYMRAQCEVWPRGKRDPAFRKPLAGDIPVLLLSGEFDPVTPPRYGDAVVATLPRGRHLVVRGQGHNVLPVGCVPKLFASFVDTADAKSLDVACLAQVPYAQPFTGFHGWEP